MRTFRINRRQVTDQTIFVKADSASEAMEKLEEFESDVVAGDFQVVKTTYRHLGEERT